jgi:hypothetical protein
VAEQFLKGKSLEELYDAVIVPALGLAEEDCLAGRLDDDQREFVFHNARLLVEDIAPRMQDIINGENDSKDHVDRRAAVRDSVLSQDPRVLSLPARGEADEVAALMLAQLLAVRGIHAKPISAEALASERLEEAGAEKIEVVCVSTVVPDGCLHVRYLCKRLREQFPNLRIVAALLIRGDAREIRRRELSASVNEVAGTLSDAANQTQALVPARAQQPGQTAFSS